MIITIVYLVVKKLLFLQDKMEDTEDIRTSVELYIYDLTKGMAAMMSPILIGKHEEMIECQYSSKYRSTFDFSGNILLNNN